MTFGKLAVLTQIFTLIILFAPPFQFQRLGIWDQPYFQGVLASLPIVDSDKEFRPMLQDAANRPEVTIEDGTLKGFTLRTVNGRQISAFQSIPFAKPPLGPLRFRDPEKNEPWKRVRDALPRSPACTQTDFVQLLRPHGQEDCLYLSVYSPHSALTSRNVSSYPVMVFIHGGAFFYGSGSSYGPKYLLERNVVLVTINYRLGPFGFFSTGDDASPGNQGMKDQVLALKWVQQNIQSFGGDPNSVTIFGESAGGTSVSLHMVSPLSRGLFHRGISQSLFCYRATRNDVATTSKRLAGMFRCPSSSNGMVECLRKVPAKVLAVAQFRLYEWLLMPIFSFAPTVEHEHPGAFMTKQPEQYYEEGQAANVNWISGVNSHEWGWVVSLLIHSFPHVRNINDDWETLGPIILSLPDNSTVANEERAVSAWEYYMGDEELSWETRHDFSKLFGDRFVTECSLASMRTHSRYTNKSVYAYHLSYQGRYGNVQQFGGIPSHWGVVHLDDLIYLLNNPNYYSSLKAGDPELQMSEIMTRIWSNFATHDYPYYSAAGNDSRGVWQPIQPATSDTSPLQFLDLSLSPKMIDDPFVERYSFMKEILEGRKRLPPFN